MKNTKFKTNIVASTAGNGLWSSAKKKVTISHLQLEHLFNYNGKYVAELRAFFSPKDWDVDNHGLIYTDQRWLKEFRENLVQNGFSKQAAKAVSYSEQGMQGENYVSLDIGDDFIKEFAIRQTFGEIGDY